MHEHFFVGPAIYTSCICTIAYTRNGCLSLGFWRRFRFRLFVLVLLLVVGLRLQARLIELRQQKPHGKESSLIAAMVYNTQRCEEALRAEGRSTATTNTRGVAVAAVPSGELVGWWDSLRSGKPCVEYFIVFQGREPFLAAWVAAFVAELRAQRLNIVYGFVAMFSNFLDALVVAFAFALAGVDLLA
mgnify:FL=1